MIQIEKYKSGAIISQKDYQYFLPNYINTNWSWSDGKINRLLESASFELGQLNSYSLLVPNIDLFIQLHIAKEAVISSKIEGTQTHIDEAFFPIENIEPKRRDDWQEIQNYTSALNSAIDELKELPISTRLILKTHKILMKGVRGQRKTPGEYRRSQNWIGGLNIKNATFVPPHHSHLNELMSDLEQFIHNDKLELPHLLMAAILHYQFETIHPFLDGNGRMGRLLITLFLIDKRVLNRPLLYLSSYFEKNKMIYYDKLTRVRTNAEMNEWIRYFLEGIIQTSKHATQTLSSVLKLKQDNDSILQNNLGRRIKPALELHNYLLKQPVVSIKNVQDVCSISARSAGELVNKFVELKFLKEDTGNLRNRIFIYEPYLKLFE